MANMNQYLRGLEDVLADQLGIHNYTMPAHPVLEVLATNPGYAVSLRETYGLSTLDLREAVFRVGVGDKLSEADSDVYEYEDIAKNPQLDSRGILCPKGILVFHEDVLFHKGSDVRMLAASYHFQTAPQVDNHPVYVRFEFDPFPASPPKPIFHYHFSAYEWFHKTCHFPAGHFAVENCYPFDDQETQKRFGPPEILSLRGFVGLLVEAELIARE